MADPVDSIGEPEEEEKELRVPSEFSLTKKAKIWSQIIGASICMLGGFTLGLAIGWSSPADAFNKKCLTNRTNICYSESQTKDIDSNMYWIGSIMNIGAMVVMIPIGWFLDHVGRKITMLILAPIVSACFILLGVTYYWYTWLVGRFFLGFSAAAFCVAAPIYVGEIAEPRIRGALGVFFQLLLVIGIAVEYTLAKANDTMWLGCISACFPMLFFVAFLFVPESPKYFLMKGKEEEARKALQWYRGKQYIIDSEFKVMQETVEAAQQEKAKLKDLLVREQLKSISMAAILMMFQQLSGINILMFYAAKIFSDAGSTLSNIDSSIILAVVQIIGTLISVLVVDKAGRKIMLYVSFSGMGVSLCCMGGWQIYLATDPKGATSGNMGVIPIIIMCIYLIFFSLGAGPVPWAMIGEIFPHKLKTYSGAISGFINWCFAFIVTASYRALNIQDAVYISVVYFIYAFLCFVGIVFFMFFVIETKGKTLEEIQEDMAN